VALPLQAEAASDTLVPADELVGIGRRPRRRHLPWFSGGVLSLFIVSGLFGPYVAPYGPNEIDLANALKAPVFFGGSWKHPLGTDDIGRDVLSRLIDGSRVALEVSLAVVVIAGVVGLAIALLAGYHGGRLDAFLMRTTDASLAFPVLLFAIVVVGVFGPSTKVVVIILAVAFWPSYARVLRSEVLHIKTMDYVTMARTMGGNGKWVVRRHVLPNIVPTLLVLLSLQLGLAIIAEGSLSFLGLGVPPPAASWGSMLSDGRKQLSAGGQGWWIPVVPAVALSLTVLATNLMGDWLRVHSDPATRR
jgi:peptide/nickel transport system permease protein